MSNEDAKVPPEICNGDFVFKQLVGYGSKVTVCIYTEKATTTDYAVKFDSFGHNNVLTECLFLRDFAQ